MGNMENWKEGTNDRNSNRKKLREGNSKEKCRKSRRVKELNLLE